MEASSYNEKVQTGLVCSISMIIDQRRIHYALASKITSSKGTQRHTQNNTSSYNNYTNYVNTHAHYSAILNRDSDYVKAETV